MKYIRFGEIPENEKSGIYRGEEKIGEEQGVSAYLAVQQPNGGYGIALSLPITKDTLDTFRHLIEYSNRECYLVEGDYVGADCDNQPLIKNVKILSTIAWRTNDGSIKLLYDNSKKIMNMNKEEPVSKDLEESAIEYCGGNKGADARVRAGFIMGANWQKEQMMKDAIDAVVCKVGNTYLKEMNKDAIAKVLEGCEDGDKVKLTIIKEEEK